MSQIEIIKLKSFTKKSGKLIPLNFDNQFPIKVKRIFYIYGKKNNHRGDHAHKKCTQVFLSLKGNIEMIIENKKGLKKLILKEFNDPIKVPPLNWVKIKMKKNQLLMAICDKKFSEKDYIRDYGIFSKKIKRLVYK